MHPQELANCMNAVQMLLATLKGDEYLKHRFNLLGLKGDLNEELNKFRRPNQQPKES